MAHSVPLIRTKTPGIYRKGNRYVLVYRDPQGRQRKRSARTLAEARNLKSATRADIDRGEYRSTSRLTFAEYAPLWAASYQGRTRSGIRPETLADYSRDLGIGRDGEPLGDGALAFFGRIRLTAITPSHIKEYATSLSRRGLAPNSVRLALAPVRLLLATAFEEGLIRSNPSAGVRVAQPQEYSETEKAKALTEDELAAFLAEIPEQHRLFFSLLAQTGLRVSEGIALQWRDIDFGKQRLSVRRRLYKGVYAAPKSRYGRREIPLSTSLAQQLWRAKPATAQETGLLFASQRGTPLDQSNLFGRVLKPAAERAGTPWAGFHTLRHTCASILFRRGFNPKQVQQFLGHHSPAFTLSTYVHLIPDDIPTPDFFDSILATPEEQAERATEGQPETQKRAETGSPA